MDFSRSETKRGRHKDDDRETSSLIRIGLLCYANTSFRIPIVSRWKTRFSNNVMGVWASHWLKRKFSRDYRITYTKKWPTKRGYTAVEETYSCRATGVGSIERPGWVVFLAQSHIYHLENDHEFDVNPRGKGATDYVQNTHTHTERIGTKLNYYVKNNTFFRSYSTCIIVDLSMERIHHTERRAPIRHQQKSANESTLSALIEGTIPDGLPPPKLSELEFVRTRKV